MLSKPSSAGPPTWKRLTYLLPLLGSAVCCVALVAGWAAIPPRPDPPNVNIMVQVSTLTPVPTFTSTPTTTPTPTVTATPPPPTSTATRVVPPEVYSRAAGQAGPDATVDALLHTSREMPPETRPTAMPPAAPQPASAPPISHSRADRLALAHYFAWFDGDGWDDCNISAGDKPLEPYHSDDPAAIARHVQMAVDTGLNGFTLHWFAPGDRTDRNFDTLLSRSAGVNFTSSIVFSRHIWHGSPAPSRQNIADALRYVIDRHSGHPNFLRLEGKPVIFFTDVYRVPVAAGETAPQFWAAVREQVDPQRQTWWIAEGLDASYLSVFDGLYVFKVSHAAFPHDYLKSPRWGAQVRQWEARTGQPKLWIATISPGWDDLRAACKPDVRAPNTAHKLDRAGGAIYRATFESALAGNPDWLIVGSFNEWVEGTYIEPSVLYGDKYLQMTREFVQQFRQAVPQP